jgi:glycosyltransferase involved in cell wall biosynthesis
MNFSIALCTYNGAEYLDAQLKSYSEQTLLPEELVVCDDGSADNTVSILEAFAAQAPFPVRVFINESTLGSTKNFEKAIGLCRGKIIALSDQDDVWLPRKLAALAEVFAQSSDVGLVFSDAEVVDDQLHPLGTRLWRHVKFTPAKQKDFRRGRAVNVLLDVNVVTGAPMAFRSQLRPLLLPIPNDIGIIHDGWIALMTSMVAKIHFVPEPLIYYRQHPAQQMGVRPGAKRPRVLPRSHYESHIRQLTKIIERLTEYDQHSAIPGLKAMRARMEAHIKHIQRRLSLPAPKIARVPQISYELLTLHYHRYSNGVRSAVRDLLG